MRFGIQVKWGKKKNRLKNLYSEIWRVFIFHPNLLEILFSIIQLRMDCIHYNIFIYLRLLENHTKLVFMTTHFPGITNNRNIIFQSDFGAFMFSLMTMYNIRLEYDFLNNSSQHRDLTLQ